MTNMNMMRTMLVGLCFVGSVWGQGTVPQPLPNFCVDANSQKVRNMACVVPNLYYDPTLNLNGTLDSVQNARGITLIGAGLTGPLLALGMKMKDRSTLGKIYLGWS